MDDEQIVEEKVVDDDQPVTEEDLRNLKYGEDGVETTTVADEPSETTEEAETTEETVSEEIGQTEETAEEETQFVKQFPQIKGDTPEEYAKNLELAYQNSTAEALRLKGLTETPAPEEPLQQPIDTSNITDLYVKQEMDEKIRVAYGDFQKKFPQVNDPTEYAKFTNEVAAFSNTILQSQGRLAPPAELYTKAAVSLGWEPETPSQDDKLKVAVKESASSSKTTSSTKKVSASKVTDAMIAANRKMYPGKTDDEIREELEPYIQ